MGTIKNRYLGAVLHFSQTTQCLKRKYFYSDTFGKEVHGTEYVNMGYCKSWKSYIPEYQEVSVHISNAHITQNLEHMEKVFHSNFLFATKFLEKWIEHIFNVEDLEFEEMHENQESFTSILLNILFAQFKLHLEVIQQVSTKSVKFLKLFLVLYFLLTVYR